MSLSTHISSVKNIFWKLYSHILLLLFPERCLGCRIKNTMICESCLSHCRKAEPFTEQYLEACFSYKDPIIKKVINRLKFRRQYSIAKKLIAPLSDLALGICSESLQTDVVLVPIPSNKARTRSRGFDQTYILAKEVAKQTGLEMTDALIRIGGDLAQSTLPRSKRLTNMRGAFAVKTPVKLAGKTVILLDDVITTGSTVREARKIIIESGARNVYAIALAH